MKELKCRDAGFDCDAVIHGESDEDVMAEVRPHAKEAQEMQAQLAGLVKDV